MSRLTLKSAAPVAAPAPAAPEAPTAEQPIAEQPTAEQPTAEQPTVVPEAPKADPAPAGILVRSLVGFMVHPFKGVSFSGEQPLEFAELDNWLKVQIEAGKLEVVK